MNRSYKQFAAIVSICVSALFLGGCTNPFGSAKNAGLIVESNPSANVYIDDQHVGNTPYNGEKIKPGDHRLKLISLTDPNQTYEAKINLRPSISTVVHHDFATTPQESTSYILDLEKINTKDQSEITIITTPPNAIVRLDDQPKGFAPLLNVVVSPGPHKITLNAQGYNTVDITTDVGAGYRLVVTAELGKNYPLKPDEASASASPSAQPTATPTPAASPLPQPSPTLAPTPQLLPAPPASPSASIPPKPYVEILPTSTGWLRVRSEPNGLVDNEVARVYPGQYFPYLEFNQSGWYKIEYAPGKQGWIASQYAKLHQ